MDSKKPLLAFSLTAALLAGCASSPVTTTVEHKGKITLVHHRQRVGTGAVDKIEAINSKGVVTTAEVHVYDIGRYVDGSGNIHEAHKVYREVQSQRPNLMLPTRVTGGPRTVATQPTYVPPPKDQRIGDAVAAAQEAKDKLDKARKNIEDRLAEDNSLRGELQQVESEKQQLQDQLNAAMATPQRSPQPTQTEAQKAAESATSELAKWGATQAQQ